MGRRGRGLENEGGTPDGQALTEQIVIERRFNGPPDSAHGGYACAVAAQFLDWSAEVSLRRPPPLERRLSVCRGDGGSVALQDGDEVVIAGRPARFDVELPAPVPLAEAEAATAASPWRERAPLSDLLRLWA